jgi:transporter family-2 protein
MTVRFRNLGADHRRRRPRYRGLSTARNRAAPRHDAPSDTYPPNNVTAPVDHIGLSPSGRQAVSRSRVIATALAVTAMGIGASEQLTAGVARSTVLAAAIPLATGAGLSVQQALNGRIARVVGPWAATVNNMVVGLATLTVAFAVSLLAAGSLNGMPGDADLYIGGLGTAFVALTSWLARIHGVLVLGPSVIAGQVLAAGAIQAALPHGHATPMSLIPVALTLTGVLIALRQRAHH